MFIENFLNALLRPFRELYSQWLRVRAIKGGIQGDVRRVQMLGQQVQNYGKSAAGYIQNAPGQVQQAMGFGGQQQVPQPVASHGSAGRTKMSWWPWGKKTCPGCNNKLHKSWDRCPYCGLSQRPGIPAGLPGVGQSGALPGVGQSGVLPGVGQSGALPGVGLAPMPTPGGGAQRTIAMSVEQINAPLLSTGNIGENIGWLVPLEGPQIGELFQIRGKSIIGSAQGCDIRIMDASISGRHAEIRVDGQNRFRITDLGSRNGTYVNDKRIESTDLVDGDNIRLGRTTFRFKTRH